MLQNLPDHEHDIWAKTIAMLVLGLACYALPWPALAETAVAPETASVLCVQGSNTIGVKLGPALAKGLME